MIDYASRAVTLDDIVFENRNQRYGAYWLRKHYDEHVLRGLFTAAAAFTLAIASPAIYAHFNPAEVITADPMVLEITFSVPLPEPPTYLPPQEMPPSLPPPATDFAQQAWVPPVITADEVFTDPATVEQLKDKVFGTETKDGEGVDFTNPMVSDGGVPGGTGIESAVVEAQAELPAFAVEQVPFLDGFSAYLQKNLHFPDQAVQADVSGIVYVNFQIAPDGSVRDVHVTKGIGYGCDEEAIRVISQSPPWTPGKQNGKPVPVRMTVPVRFKLN